MSKKKTTKNTSSVIDSELLNKQAASVNEASVKEVSLKEFSKNAPYAFNKENYKLLLTGLAINVLGFILMIGGGAEDPNEFHYDELFSHVRITIAPMLIVIGYAVILYAIMKKPKSRQ